MYHAESIDIQKTDILFPYLDDACACTNNMYNVTNFFIRNLMTGSGKELSQKTENERFVEDTVSSAVPKINGRAAERYERRKKEIEADPGLDAAEKKAKIEDICVRYFEMPSSEKWFAGYPLLDAVFKQTDNKDYRAHHSHVMQNAIKTCVNAWSGYFRSLKTFCHGSGHTGRPKIPKYKRSGGRSTAVFSSLACSIRNGCLRFPRVKRDCPMFPSGKDLYIRITGLPHASGDVLIEVRVVPYFDRYQIQIITDDGIKETDIMPDEKGIIKPDGTPAGVMMLDPGLDNFAAITDNKGNTPILIKGGALKAHNQWYNKQMAFLKSEQMKGHDPKKYHPHTTERMKRLSRKRKAFMKDAFYKYAHYIFRLMKERGLSYLIVGHNKGQKQKVCMGHVNNRSFVQIPFYRFIAVLVTTAAKYGVCVLLQEESYTSKACFSERDPMPVYGDNGTEKTVFSGKRICRGLYRQPDGKVINADINGSLNIGRKYREDIIPRDMDTSRLYGKVQAMTHADIINASHKRKVVPAVPLGQ